MEKLHFDFRDILWAPARALSAKQIFVMTFFVIAALVVFDIFYYLAQMFAGERLGLVFSAYGFFPFEHFRFDSVPSQISLGAGIVLGILTVMLGFFGVAAINIESIRGNRFFSNIEAIKFAFKRLKQIFLSELAIVLFVAFIVFLFFLLGLLSRIPYLGDWLFALLFALPNFVIAILTVFIIFIFTLSVVLLPAVAAAERHGESFSVILETFSTIIRQPARWFGYTLYALTAAKVCGFIYAYFAYRAVQFIGWATALGGGDNIVRLIRSGLSHLPVKSDLVVETFNIFPGIDFSFAVSGWAMGGTGNPAGYVMAVMLFLIFATIIGYMLAIVAAAQARAFVVIRKIKDDYNIAKESSLFYIEEHVNPEIDEVVE
ncbi:MAG: hypothetical protein JXA92_11465 [candidate division Zixibacteria bacterium]|nr:hypothetical protein [candidate division Zixibacteria bacterium]